MGLMVVYLVVNGVVLDGYINEGHANTHARTVTGARVVPLYIRDRLAPTVGDDLAIDGEHADEEEVTPAPTPLSDVTQTKPGTPKAIARSRRPLK